MNEPTATARVHVGYAYEIGLFYMLYRKVLKEVVGLGGKVGKREGCVGCRCVDQHIERRIDVEEDEQPGEKHEKDDGMEWKETYQERV